MKNLCAGFEIWCIGDGNYPYYKVGDKANFAITITSVKTRKPKKKRKFLQRKKSSLYSFGGQVIRKYKVDAGITMLIIDTGEYNLLIFYWSSYDKPRLRSFIEGKGELSVDANYIFWMYFDLENLPKVYYDFYIQKITGIIYPENDDISDDDDIIIMPTSISPKDFNENNMFDVTDMENDKVSSYYVLYLVPPEGGE